MEMRMQGLGVYAELLADTKLQTIGKGKLAKGRKDKAPAVELGLLDVCVLHQAFTLYPPKTRGEFRDD